MATIKTIPDEEGYVHLYDTRAEFDADYNGDVYHEDWVSYIIETEEVHYNKMLVMSVQELIDNGYAEIKQDRAKFSPGSEVNYNVIQIHTNCPVKLENITDFDDYLTSATTFVWREELPSGWKPKELAAKYNGVELYRPISPEIFTCVDLSGVDELSLSFAGEEWAFTHSSIISERFNENHDYYPGVTFKTPKHLTITVRGIYSSVAQTNFSMLNTTTGITLNCGGVFSCHDVTGMFEHNPELEELVITGPFRWDGWRTCHLAFDGCSKLKSIPYVTSWGRDDEANAIYNTIYPRFDGARGTANCGGMFNNCLELEFLGPRINMNAISLSGCTADGYSQDALGYIGKGLFYCPKLTNVRIINLNNNDWNFGDDSTYTYIPNMNIASINFLLNHVADVTSQGGHVVKFAKGFNQVSSSAITNANNKGWTVQFNDSTD